MSTAVRSRRVPVPVIAGIAAAWALAAMAEATGTGRLLHHDTLIEGGLPFWVALGLFVVAWQAMIAAMMLPSSLPFVRLFAVTSRTHATKFATRVPRDPTACAICARLQEFFDVFASGA